MPFLIAKTSSKKISKLRHLNFLLRLTKSMKRNKNKIHTWHLLPDKGSSTVLLKYLTLRCRCVISLYGFTPDFSLKSSPASIGLLQSKEQVAH